MRARSCLQELDMKIPGAIKRVFLKPLLKNRTGLLNYLAQRFKYESYLEIGCSYGKNFNKVDVPLKVGVDPKQGGTFRGTSDEFFSMNDARFDLIFIDGLHHARQALKDVHNSIKVLRRGGIIVMHDCNPLSEEAQRVPRTEMGGTWNGDVWRTTLALRICDDLDVGVGNFDYGCGLILQRANTAPLLLDDDPLTVSYDALDRNRERWLRLMNSSQLLRFLSGY